MLFSDVSLSLDLFVLRVGASILAAHCALYVLFAHILPRGPWTSLPSFTAHQAVCLPLMIYLSYEGSRAWFSPSVAAFITDDGPFAGSADRIVEVVPAGERLAKIVLGMQLLWDIPVGLTTSALRDPLMAAHHVGMALVSGAGAGLYSDGRPLVSYYSPFFFGVIEISSIFLTVVDLFHPKQKAWYDYLQNSRTGGTLAAINDLCRMAFALSYLVLRAAYFPYVVLTGILPDCRAVIVDMSEEERSGKGVPLVVPWGIAVFSLLFAALQVYWGVLVARQVIKAIGFGGEDRKEKKKKEK